MDEEQSRTLWAAWRAAADPAVAVRMLDGMAVPGSVALRARYQLLTDPLFHPHPNESFDTPWDKWSEHLRLETEGDDALIANETAAAERVFSELLGLECQVHHRLVTANALIGLGDAARQRDDHEVAATRYSEAVRASTASLYRFGLVRALVPLAHLTLTISSATEALAMFDRAEVVARELDERLYVANALTGRGEVLARLSRQDEALPLLREALEICDAIGSVVGAGNAAQRLGEVLYRNGDLSGAAQALESAVAAFEGEASPVGACNAADSLADVLLRGGDPKAAVREYQRAFAFAEAGDYGRGQAHAYAGVARCAAVVGEWKLSESLHRDALTVYEDLGDLPGRTASLAGLAECASAAGNHGQASGRYLEAVGSIEAMRAAHDRDDLQREYRQRFTTIYRNALRCAVVADDPDAFVAVFEGLAGRRLAGLLERVANDARSTEAHARTADGGQQHGSRDASNEGVDRQARLFSMLGTAGRLAGLERPVREKLEETASALYQAFDPSSGPALLGELAGAHLLLLTPVLGREREVARLWRTPHGETRLDVQRLDERAQALLSPFEQRGMDPGTLPSEVAPLASLLPEGLRDAADDGDDGLVIVPLGSLWSVPWPGVPLPSGRFLGQTTRLAVAPSLTVYQRVAARPLRRSAGEPLRVACWRSPNVLHHNLKGFADARFERRNLTGPAATRKALISGHDDLVVVAGHGLPVAGTSHYLELAPGESLTPADLLGSAAPELMVLVACWGAATPSPNASDPLTLATMALAAGSRHVAATVAELGDNVWATRFVEFFLERLADTSMPTALRDATAEALRDARIRTGPLKNWAPLVTVGSL